MRKGDKACDSRPRYRDEEEEELRPRKGHSDRSRDRYYDRDRDRGGERGRDRSLDRGKDRTADRAPDRERPYSTRPLDREREMDRTRTGSRSKDLQEVTDSPARRPNGYDRTERTTTTSTTTTCMPEQLLHKPDSESKEPGERSERPDRTNQQTDYQERDQEDRREPGHYQASSMEEYSQEYYDEPEDPPTPPPRTAVRIVKRPFLPSRGGNANPRGLSAVGSKATTPKREEDRVTERTALQERPKNYYLHEPVEDSSRGSDQDSKAQPEEKESYDPYKTVQTENQHERRPEEYDTTIVRPAIRRPLDRQREEETQKPVEETFVRGSKQGQDRQNYEEGLTNDKWSTEDYSILAEGNEGSAQPPSSSLRGKGRLTASESPSIYGSTLKNEENQEHPTGPGSFRVKQRINEVTHRLQDIPESEYDVTLNDALTPTLNQEANLPSGFVLPLHRQIAGRDAVLQSSENNYKVSRPVNQQPQKPFVPSPQFLPAVSNNDRLRTVFYRQPETIHISGTQYRQQRGPWHDYTGY